MKIRLALLLLLAGGSLFAGGPRVVVGIGLGGYGYGPPVVAYAPPPPPPVYYAPPCPGPGYSWVSGYWYPVGARYQWRAGYWGRPAYARPYYRDYRGPRYYKGRGHHHHGRGHR